MAAQPVQSFLYSDLAEIKRLLQLDLDDHTEDFTLSLYNQWAAGIIEEVVDRSVCYGVRTWVYPGTGTQKLVLKHRPVYPTTAPTKASSLPFTAIQVKIDESANFGEAANAFTDTDGTDTLVYGTDYCIRIDQDDGGSREAILYRNNDTWPKPFIRQAGVLSASVGPDLGSVQVVYTAGWTIDTLPHSFRMAADWLIVKMAYLFPLGMQLTSESYIDRSIGISDNQRRYLLGAVRPMLFWHKNWKF